MLRTFRATLLCAACLTDASSTASAAPPAPQAHAQSAPAPTAVASPAPAQSAPARSAPAQSAPAQSAPAPSAPARSAVTPSAPGQTAPAQTAPTRSAVAPATADPSAPGSARPGPRGIVIISVDTLRADQLGCYGDERVATPNLDRLAREALIFDRAYSPSTLTHPSLTSMLTGLLPHRTGVHDQVGRLPDDVVPLASILRDTGRATGAFVANLCKLQPEPGSVFHRGWDTRFCGMDDDQEQHAWDAAVVGAALDWIAEQQGPYLAWLHLMDPHAEHRPPPDLWDYRARPVLKKFPQYHAFNTWEAERRSPPPEDYAEIWDLYAAEVAGVDRQVGRVLAALQPQRDETAIIFTADHGEELYETWPRYDHGGSLTEGVVWVPLLVRAPGVTPGRVRPPVELSQVTPTVLELAGATAPVPLDGPSLLAEQPSRGWALSFVGTIAWSLRTSTHRYYLRTTAEPWTRPPDQAPWRVEAPWFQRKQALASYPHDVRTQVEWISPQAPENRRLVRHLRTLLEDFMAALGTPVEQASILDPALEEQLRQLGYVGEDATHEDNDR